MKKLPFFDDNNSKEPSGKEEEEMEVPMTTPRNTVFHEPALKGLHPTRHQEEVHQAKPSTGNTERPIMELEDVKNLLFMMIRGRSLPRTYAGNDGHRINIFA